ncbi:MAG: mechanosensitive ion channel family protein [Cyanobacteria bacterium CRU_2_1]|nr:mechanosensitive ion channel family protein [Cyanobacteria bacterium RU_5_0]NJR62354.1 mechanosensitive ion channel family protein [Cyanobacteria bacterium CRU_2_1]
MRLTQRLKSISQLIRMGYGARSPAVTKHLHWGKWISPTIAALLSCTLVIAWAPTVSGQLSIPSPPVQTQGLPPDVQRVGAIETAPVHFENRELFRVTAAAVPNRDQPNGAILVEVRAEQIEANLQRVVAEDPGWNPNSARKYSTTFDPETFRVEVAKLNNQTILQAMDAYREPQDLLTVTELDARYYGLTIDELARQWKLSLQERLGRSLEARLPEVFRQQIQQAIRVGGSMIGTSVILWLMQRILKFRNRRLRAKQTEQAVEASKSTANPDPSELTSRHSYRVEFLEALHLQFTLERRLNFIALMRWLLFWGQVVVWLGGIILILYIFPSTEAFAEELLSVPIMLLAIWFMIGFLNRIGDVLISRFSKAWENSDFFAFGEDVQRRSLRISTIIRATKGLKTFLVYAIGLGAALGSLGVPVGSVLTFGAVVALAVSLASQNLIKDLLNGFLILSEDQYAIGDVIAVGTVSGFVENMNLRITQVRNTEGRLITIPNSSISQVENLTRIWSRSDFMISIAYSANVKQAIEILNQVSQEMYTDPVWHPLLLKAPDVLGVEDLTHAGIVLRVWIDTQPLEQWKVGREFRLRVRLAFEQYGIEIGMPQQMIWHRDETEAIQPIDLDGIEHPQNEGNGTDRFFKDGMETIFSDRL